MARKLSKKTCQRLVSQKISEIKREGTAMSTQAVAIGFSQVRRAHPSCRRFFPERK